MKSRPLEIFSSKFAVLTLVAGLAAGCGPQNNHHEPVARSGGQRIRVVCADDIQKFCANDQRKRRCLRENIDKLSDACKAFLAEQHGGNKGNRTNTDNN